MKKTIAVIMISLFPAVASASSMIDTLNDYRLANGVAPVSELASICALVDIRLKEIKTDWSHDGFFKLITPLKKTGVWYENLAREGTMIRGMQGVFDAWVASPSHNKNLLSKMTSVCIKKSGIYWTLIGWKSY